MEKDDNPLPANLVAKILTSLNGSKPQQHPRTLIILGALRSVMNPYRPFFDDERLLIGGRQLTRKLVGTVWGYFNQDLNLN